MNREFERYLGELHHEMARLPAEERDDAIREIESHMSEASASGQAPSDVLFRLGSPRALASALIADRLERRKPDSRLDVRQAIVAWSFIAGSSLSSVLLVPMLAGLAVGFTLMAPISLGLGIMRTFGASWIHLDYAPGQPMPVALSIPFSIGVSAASLLVAWLAYRGLRLYLHLVALGYRRVMNVSLWGSYP